MAHFGDCCDPFMRLRMASNGYEAISLSSPRVLRTRVLPLGAELVPWSWIASFWVLDSRLTIFSLQLRLRFLLLLCFWFSLVFLGLLAAYLENVAASPNAIQMCVSVCICVLCKFFVSFACCWFFRLGTKISRDGKWRVRAGAGKVEK